MGVAKRVRRFRKAGEGSSHAAHGGRDGAKGCWLIDAVNSGRLLGPGAAVLRPATVVTRSARLHELDQLRQQHKLSA